MVELNCVKFNNHLSSSGPYKARTRRDWPRTGAKKPKYNMPMLL